MPRRLFPLRSIPALEVGRLSHRMIVDSNPCPWSDKALPHNWKFFVQLETTLHQAGRDSHRSVLILANGVVVADSCEQLFVSNFRPLIKMKRMAALWLARFPTRLGNGPDKGQRSAIWTVAHGAGVLKPRCFHLARRWRRQKVPRARRSGGGRFHSGKRLQRHFARDGVAAAEP